MKNALPLCLLMLLPLVTAGGQEETSPPVDSGAAFAFAGVNVYRPYQKEITPVVGAAKKKLKIQTAKGIKRVGFGTGEVRLESRIVATDLYANIGEVDYRFDNLAQSRRDARYQADLEAEASFAEDRIDMINASTSPRVVGQPANMDKATYAETLARDAEVAREMKEEYYFTESQKSDTLYLSFEVVPEIDIEDAYGVVVVTNASPAQDDQSAGKSVFMSIEYFGDLQNRVPNKVKFPVNTFEQIMRELDFRFFLFAGDGTPVATNRSGPMKRVTRAELQALQQQPKVLAP